MTSIAAVPERDIKQSGRPQLEFQRNVLGVGISATTIAKAAGIVLSAALSKRPAMVCVADVNSLLLARRSRSHRAAFAASVLVVSDGVPIVWQLRALGCRMSERVAGTDLVHAVCEADNERRLRHYFFGGRPEVAQATADALAAKHGVKVVGVESPPFRPLTSSENQQVRDRIRASGATIVWVGLGCPKQEAWMLENTNWIEATLVGVGAAFDFVAGSKRRAPSWMQKAGLEWLHRFGTEPRRLWRRYLAAVACFLPLAVAQLVAARSRSIRARLWTIPWMRSRRNAANARKADSNKDL